MHNDIIKVTARCQIRTTLELVGGKWKLLIMFLLANNSHRPSELKRLMPDISEKMLIQELKNLIDSRLVERKNVDAVPTSVLYELTDIGHQIIPVIAAMKTFADAYENQLT